MLALPLLALLAAADPAPAAAASANQKPPLKLAAPGLRSVGLPADVATFWGDQLSQELSLAGAKVTTPAELAALLGIERQKQLLGCSEEGGSCMTELAGALGVDALITGTIAKVGDGFQVNVKILDANNGNALSTASASADNDKELVKKLRRLARAVASELFQKLDRAPVVSTAARALEGGTVRSLAWLPAAVGVVALGVAVGLVVYSDGLYKSLTEPTSNLLNPERTAANGKLADALSITMFCVGGVGLAAAALMFAFGGPKQVDLYVAPVAGTNGAGLVFGASL